MTLIKFDPFRGFEGVARRMNQFMNEFDKGFRFETGGFNPRVDIVEDENNIYINAEIPGLNKENVNVSVNEDRIMTIKGEKKYENIEEGKAFIRSERAFGSFTRSFLILENIDLEKIDAKFNDGVLEISIAKKEPEKPIEISVEIK